MSKARLRTKTGCLLCRKRKIKCGEERPQCRNCLVHHCQCEWPLERDLVDRRNLLWYTQDQLVISESALDVAQPPDMKSFTNVRLTSSASWLCLDPCSLGVTSKAELDLLHHFNSTWYMYVLPNPPKDAEYNCLSYLFNIIQRNEGMKYSVLAFAATHKYMLGGDSRYELTALDFYVRAVREVNLALSRLPMVETSKSKSAKQVLLAAIVFLYDVESWGPGAGTNAAQHFYGALKLRSLDDNYGSLSQLPTYHFHRLVPESILYQALSLTLKDPFHPGIHFDKDIISWAETILDSEAVMPENELLSIPKNHIIGLPLPLYRIIWRIVELRRIPNIPDTDAISTLQMELEPWEAAVLNLWPDSDSNPQNDASSTSQQSDTIALYVLSASLLLEWVTQASYLQVPIFDATLSKQQSQSNDPNSLQGCYRWQVDLALRILRKAESLDPWTSNYITVWPMLIFGYAVDSQYDAAFIREILRLSLQRTGYGEVKRIAEELDEVWKLRQMY